MHTHGQNSRAAARRRLLMSSAFVALALAGTASVAQAQDAAQEAPQEPETSANNSATAIDDIVVTARRREENLRDVPISAQALSAETIANKNIVALEELSAYTPNFRQTSAIISPYRAMRGVSSGSNFSFDQAVGAFTDGVYVGRAQYGRLPFYDIERVEVLRGPQVILFGNSTTAGAISSTTRKPGDTFEGYARGSYEAFNQETILEGGVTVPMGDKFSVRVAGFSQVLAEGWVQSNFNGAHTQDPRFDTQSLRVTAVYRPTDDLKATLRWERSDIQVDGGLQQAVLNRLNNPLVGEINFDNHRTVGSGAPLGVNDQNGVPNDFIRLTPEILVGTVEYNVGDFTLTSVTGYTDFDYRQSVESDWIAAPFANIVQHESYQQFSQEFRLAGDIGSFINFQAGAYYQKDTKEGDLRFDFNFPAIGLALPAFGFNAGGTFESESWSAFTDVTFNLSDRLRLGVGARYTEADRINNQYNHASVIGTGARYPFIENTVLPSGRTIMATAGAGTAHDYLDIRDSESHFQPQVLVQYDITPDVMGYVKYVEGAKAGGYDWSYRGADPRGGIFLPETAKSYEVGVKGIFFNRSLSVELQGYRTEFSDLQVSAFDGVGSLVVRNAASQVSQGVELETTWRATPELTINFSGAYLDAVYEGFPSGSCNFISRSATPAGTTCVQNYSGTRPAFQSEWSSNFGFAYEGALTDGFYLTPRLDFNYRSSYNASTNNDPAALQSGYVTVDARLELTRDGAPWTVAVFGKNITDEHYMEFFLDAPAINGLSSAVINRGRQVGLQVSSKF